MSWNDWWVWMAVGVALGIFEILIPASVFLGFAIGAGFVGALLLFGVPTGGLYLTLLIWAVVSAVAWVALRRFVGVRPDQTKFIDRDIND